MKIIAKKIWNEPAAFIGLLTTLILAGINVIGDDDWGIDNIIAVLAPLVSALGIRSAVIPVGKLDEKLEEMTAPKGTTYQKPEVYDQKKE